MGLLCKGRQVNTFTIINPLIINAKQQINFLVALCPQLRKTAKQTYLHFEILERLLKYIVSNRYVREEVRCKHPILLNSGS